MSAPPMNEKPLTHDLLNDPITTNNNVDAAVPTSVHHETPSPAARGPPSVSASNGALSNFAASATNGPIAQNVKNAIGNTQSDFQGLANSKETPTQTTATGQPLTTYHSFFYNLITWKHPRATAVSFLVSVALIFVARYFPLTKWVLKGLVYAFGATLVAELAGKPFGQAGFVTRIRPRQYYVLPKDSVDALLSEVHELANFFVLEFQRILFVENSVLTAAAGMSAAIAYGLIKFVPLWGLTLIATSIMYFAPLIYIKNQELIDSHLDHATSVVNNQAAQVKELTAHHTARATEAAKGYASDLTARASDLVAQAKGTSISSAPAPPKTEPISQKSFPVAPKKEPSAQPVAVN